MGLLDQLVGGLGGQGQGAGGGLQGLLGGLLGGKGGASGAAFAALVPIVLSVLQDRSGGSDGLGALLDKLRSGGLGAQVESWLGTGANLPVSAQQVVQALGAGDVSRIATQAGLSTEQAGEGIAAILPAIVDRLSPGGSQPQGADLEGAVSALRKQFGL